MTNAHELDESALAATVKAALAEDLGEQGDITSKRIVRVDQPGRARIVAKETGILAGSPVAEATFHAVDKTIQIEWLVGEGSSLKPGAVVAEISGRARAILAAERVALNFLQHLSGVATLTKEFVDRCSKHGVTVLCTRKTIPGLRAIQRYAVVVGGARLHRAGLYDAILIKTNHGRLAGGIGQALIRTKANPTLVVEVEVRTMGELTESLAGGADKILLDNAPIELVPKVVAATKGKAFLEISGGITLDNVEEFAAFGPDAISIGQLTHSAPAVDLSLEILGPAGAVPKS